MKFPQTTIAETFLASVGSEVIVLDVWAGYQLLNRGRNEACVFPPAYWIVEDRSGKQYHVINHDTFKADDGSIANRLTAYEIS